MNKKIENNKYIHAGEKIKYIRHYLGIAKADFASMIGYSTTQITNMENGKVEVREGTIQQICSKLCIEEAYFRDGEVEDVGLYAGRDTSDYDGKSVSKRLRELREAKGWTQIQLAELSGAAQSVISYVENGQKRLSPKQAEKIAESLGVGAEYLLTGNLKKKDFPVNEKMINWLWDHEAERREIWRKMRSK